MKRTPFLIDAAAWRGMRRPVISFQRNTSATIWPDERQHVAFGSKWLPELMAQNNIDMPVEQFIEETVALWQREYVSGDLPLHAERQVLS